jgi:hypothetical protein
MGIRVQQQRRYKMTTYTKQAALNANVRKWNVEGHTAGGSTLKFSVAASDYFQAKRIAEKRAHNGSIWKIALAA